jgi:hypothetical protein
MVHLLAATRAGLRYGVHEAFLFNVASHFLLGVVPTFAARSPDTDRYDRHNEAASIGVRLPEPWCAGNRCNRRFASQVRRRGIFDGTSLALRAAVRTKIVICAFVATAACAPAQRTAVGAGMAGAGLLVSSAAIESMAEPCREYGEQHTCLDPRKAHASEGIAVVLSGLGVAVVGGAILASAHETSPLRPAFSSETDPRPETPTSLDKSDAIGMALAQLVLVGIDGNRKPGKLLEVDDTRSTLTTVGRHAELSKLRVRVASDGSWLTLAACYEYENDWQVSSLGTTTACGP